MKELGLAYLRVSTHHQRAWSPLKQYEAVKEYVRNKAYKFSHYLLKDAEIELDESKIAHVVDKLASEDFKAPGAFYDEESGWSRKKRAKARKKGELEFQNMVNYLKKQNGKVAHLFFFLKSRFGRNLEDLPTFEKLCTDLYEKKGVKVFMHFVSEHEVICPAIDTSKWNAFCKKIIDEKDQSDQKSQWSKEGKARALKHGLLAYDSPYGYENYTDTDGIRKAKFDSYAPMVKAMFKLAEKGHSIRQIMDIINKDWKPKRGKKFGKTTVKNILSSRFYLGEIKNTRTEGNKKIEEWNKSNVHEALISKAQFDAVQKQLKSRNTKAHLVFDIRKKHALAEKIKCMICGCSFTQDRQKGQYRYLRCSSSKRNVSQADKKAGRAEEKRNWYVNKSKEENWLEKYGKESKGYCINPYRREEIFWDLIEDGVKKLRLHDEVIEEIKSIFQEAGLEHKQELNEKVTSIQAKLADLDLERSKYVKAIALHPELAEDFKRELQRVLKDIEFKNQEMEDLEQESNINKTELERVLEIASLLGKKWEKGLEKTEKEKLAQILVLEIKVHMSEIEIFWEKPFDLLIRMSEKKEGSKLKRDRHPQSPGRFRFEDHSDFSQGIYQMGFDREYHRLAHRLLCDEKNAPNVCLPHSDRNRPIRLFRFDRCNGCHAHSKLSSTQSRTI